jgi:hypothetical protein
MDILSAENGSLSVREDGGDLEASWALNIQEIAVWRLN